MVHFECPCCGRDVCPDTAPHCPHCGTEIRMCSEILFASYDSLQLALLALAEGRDKDAHDFAYESWGLRHTVEASAAGLLAAVLLKEPVEIARWLRRRSRMQGAENG